MAIKHYEVIVVGGGIAGITAATYLGRANIPTLLIEKNEKLGGLVGSFEINGFTFDSGIRAFENSGIVFPMLKQLGLKMDFIANPVSIGIDQSIIHLSDRSSLTSYLEMLSRHFPKNRQDIIAIGEEIKKTIRYMDVLYGIDNPLFMDIGDDKEYIFKTLLPWLFKYQINIKKASKLNEDINQYLLRFTKNQALIDMITQHFFQHTPTFFALSYFGLYLDYNYPRGGTGKLISLLEDYLLKQQVDLAKSCRIERIDLQKKQIFDQNGTCYQYQNLVWCADMTHFYRSLNPESRTQKITEKQKVIDVNKGCDSILSVYLGVKLAPDYFEKISGEHIFYTPKTIGLSDPVLGKWQDIVNAKLDVEYEKFELKRWINLYLELTTYEISIPALRDSSLAPQGHTGLIISTLFDYHLTQHIQQQGWYEECKQMIQNKVIQVLGDSLFPSLKNQVTFVQCSTPLTLERFTGNLHGAITGWAFNKSSMPSETRFKKIAKSVETGITDVYQAGQWTFSPSGLPVSMVTGKVAADRIIKKRKRK